MIYWRVVIRYTANEECLKKAAPEAKNMAPDGNPHRQTLCARRRIYSVFKE